MVDLDGSTVHVVQLGDAVIVSVAYYQCCFNYLNLIPKTDLVGPGVKGGSINILKLKFHHRKKLIQKRMFFGS